MKTWITRYSILLSMMLCELSLNDAAATIGDGGKDAVLVDKVMIASTKWRVERWMVKKAKEAGFTAYVPRRYHIDVNDSRFAQEIEKLSNWCLESGIETFYWMRGTIESGHSASLADKQYIPDRKIHSLWSPNTDEFWQEITSKIIRIAELSTTNKALSGVFLDFENYDKNRDSATAYSYSYDTYTAERFDQAAGSAVSGFDALDRKGILSRPEKSKIHREYKDFQLSLWQERLRNLRSEVDKINPSFQFIVYPFNGTKTNFSPFLYGDSESEIVQSAPIFKLATKNVNLVFAESRSYKKPLSLIHDSRTVIGEVEANIIESIADARNIGSDVIVIGGTDPLFEMNSHTGEVERPGYVHQSSVVMSEHSSGYWVFYEGLNYPSEIHDYYMEGFSWANRNIATENWSQSKIDFARKYNWGVFSEAINEAPVSFNKHDGSGFTLPRKKMSYVRGKVLLAFGGLHAEYVDVVLKGKGIGSNSRIPIACELRAYNDLGKILNDCTFGSSGTKRVRYRSSGKTDYMFLVSGGNLFAVESASVMFAFYAGDYINFHKNKEQLYFAVLPGRDRFTISVKGQGREHVNLMLYDPDGKFRGNLNSAVSDSKLGRAELTMSQNVKEGVWSLAPHPALGHRLEDYSIKLRGGVVPYIALDPGWLENIGFTEHP